MSAERVTQLRQDLAQAAQRIAELEQQRRSSADDAAAYHKAGEAIAHERSESERLTVLLQSAEAEQREAELAAKRAELTRATAAFKTAQAAIQPCADAYAAALADAWKARRGIDGAVREATNHRDRARRLAAELGESLDIDDRALPPLAHAAALAAMHKHAAHFVELTGWLAPPRDLEKCVYMVRTTLSLPLHIGAPYPLEAQLEDMLSGRYLAVYNELAAGRRASVHVESSPEHDA